MSPSREEENELSMLKDELSMLKDELTVLTNSYIELLFMFNCLS